LAQGEGAFQDRAKRLLDDVAGQSQYVRDIVDFVLGESDRSFLTPG
jgi:UDP-N-acetylglucosamine acyltransferase